jgi:hypothetical protein
VLPYESQTPASTTLLDKQLLPVFKRLQLEFAPNASDAVFLRRVYLDITGRLPPLKIAQSFIANPNPEKRAAIIDELLESDASAMYWAMKWSDLLRIKSEFPINLWPNAAQAYHEWVYQSLRENISYDVFARELLTSSGSNFRKPAVNFYRALQGQDAASIAQTVALTFMGLRFDAMPEADRRNFEKFFSRVAFKPTAEWKEEIIYLNPYEYTPLQLTTLDGRVLHMTANEDPRQLFADWLIAADNKWFARNMVNRQWAWLMGRGIVHEPDDMRLDNVPSHPELLDFLEKELILSGYDMKHIFRLILNSRCYQQSSTPMDDNHLAVEYFAAYRARRLDAEVLSDVLCDLTDTYEEYVSMIPEPFTYIPANTRTVALADGSINSAFLQLFGRPERDSGLFSERNSDFTSKQALHLLNSSHVSSKINNSKWVKMLASGQINFEQLRPVYLAIFSREPTAAEVSYVQNYFSSVSTRPLIAAQDLVWAMINSKEFLFNH